VVVCCSVLQCVAVCTLLFWQPPSVASCPGAVHLKKNVKSDRVCNIQTRSDFTF